jgi:replicative DNA helicase
LIEIRGSIFDTRPYKSERIRMEEISIRKSKIAGFGHAKSADLSQMVFSKVPPQAIDLEQAVLGALLLEQDALSETIDILKPESFYVPANAIVYRAVMRLFERAQPVDILTVAEELRKSGELDLIGGPFYLTELTNRVASSANVEYHSRIIIQKFIQRELIRVSTEIVRDAYEDTTDVFDLLDKAEQGIFNVADQNLRRSTQSMSHLLTKAIKEISDLRNSDSSFTGVPSGFSALDRITHGWQPSDLMIIAARPAMGKTAFVLSMARNAALLHNIPVALFSLEMSSVQLVKRLISAEAEINGDKIRSGEMADHEWEQLNARIERLAEAPIFIDDTPAINVFELRAKCRRLKSAHNIQLIIVDYLQLMQGSSENNRSGTREQEISQISRSLKIIAKELNVPVIALSQLSRAVEQRGGDKRPILSDLRESGSLEQDADMVCFLYRPEYYGFHQDESGSSLEHVAEVIIAKHRNGPTDTVQLKFINSQARFADLDELSNDMLNIRQSRVMPSKMNRESSGDKGSSGIITLGSKMNVDPPIGENFDPNDPEAELF